MDCHGIMGSPLMGVPIDDVRCFKKRIMHLAERFSEEVPDTPTDTPDAGRASSHFGSVSVPSNSVLANGEEKTWRMGYLEVVLWSIRSIRSTSGDLYDSVSDGLWMASCCFIMAKDSQNCLTFSKWVWMPRRDFGASRNITLFWRKTRSGW